MKVKTPKLIQREQMKLRQLGQLVKLLPSVRAPIERATARGHSENWVRG